MLRSILAKTHAARVERAAGREHAFTLVELMVVALVIGLLASIAIPIFMTQQAESVRASVRSDVRNTISNVGTFMARNPAGLVSPESQTGTRTVEGSPIDIVVSDEATTVQVIPGDRRGAYRVTGSNSVVDFSYVFDSETGQFVPGTAIAAVSGSGSGSTGTPGGAQTWNETLRNRVGNPMTVPSGSGWFTSSVNASYVGGRHQAVSRGTANATTFVSPHTGAGSDVIATRYVVTPGERVSFRARVWNPSTTTALFMRGGFQFYNEAGTGASGASSMHNTVVVAIPPGGSAVVEHSVIVPTGTNNSVRGVLPMVYLTRDASGSLAPLSAGTVFQHSEWALYSGADGSIPTSNIPFISGSTPSGVSLQHRWLGTPHASASVREVQR